MDATMMLLLKPGPFVITEEGDPEQLMADFIKYKENFLEFLAATKASGNHTENHANCASCVANKAQLKMIGGEAMKDLFIHTGGVVAEDTFDEALDKIEVGIRAQTNQAAAKFKLFQEMPQEGRTFGQWYIKVKEQADRCNWSNYNSKYAARDAILFQTNNKKLQHKIMTEDLSYDNTVKYRLALN